MFAPLKSDRVYLRLILQMHRRRLWRLLGGSVAAMLVSNGQAEEGWDTSTCGFWSNVLRGRDATAPPAGGDPALILRFAGEFANAYTATNDLGAPFALNRMIF